MKYIKNKIKAYRGPKNYYPRSIMIPIGDTEIMALEMDSNFAIVYNEDLHIAEFIETSNELVLGTSKSFLRGGNNYRLGEIWNLFGVYYQLDPWTMRVKGRGKFGKEIAEFVQNVEFKLAIKGR